VLHLFVLWRPVAFGSRGVCCAVGVCGKVQVTNGEVFLKGNYIELGLHAAGSFGTVAPAPVSFNGAVGPGLKNPWAAGVGFSVDYNRDGFGVGSPTAFSGDYFLPGSPVEGIATSWRTTSTGTPIVSVNKGRMGKSDIPQVGSVLDGGSTAWRRWAQQGGFLLPVCFMSQAWVDATSSSGVVLSSWVGRAGGMEIRRTVYFGETDVSIYMHTTIVNVGAAKLFDVRYLRSIDPDQEQPWNTDTTDYVTNNYVKYQYQASYAGK
jgi:hypothetical protein